MDIFTLIGSIGSVILILFYFLLQINYVSSNSFVYSFFNALGSFLIIISILDKWNLPAFIIESFWIIISIYGMYKIIKKSKIKDTNE